MYVSYEVFSKTLNEDLFFGLNVPNKNIESTRQLIEKLREINKKDPRFIYTCAEDMFGGSITWYFSYTVKECFDQAKSLVEEDCKEERRRDGEPEDDIHGHQPFFEEGCSCPFL